MITLEADTLTIEFPEIHKEAKAQIKFHRTLRIPDNGNEYPLPPGLGHLPLRHVDDYRDRVPGEWLERGGVMLPLYQAEAMWIGFGREHRSYPFAVKIAAGKINAISGKPWEAELEASEDDYLVLPNQPWLDGFAVAKDVVRQFVAMPLGEGYSAEEQITGKAEWGGLQIIAYPMKAARYERLKLEREKQERMTPRRIACAASVGASPMTAAAPMGLAPGGRMSQQIYADPHGIDAWSRVASSRCFVTLADAITWTEITGTKPPHKPPTSQVYTEAGLPWFDYYEADARTLDGAAALSPLKSVAEMAAEKGENPQGPDVHIKPKRIVALGPNGSGARRLRPVREGGV